MQTMDDGVPIAFTRYTPDGAAPAGGRPGVLVLHGLAGNRGSVDAIASTFANAGYSVLAYDARGHGDFRRRDHARRAARGRRPARAPQRVRRSARGQRHDRRLGDLVRRRPDLERARRRRAARRGRGGRDVDVALRRALAAGPRAVRDRGRLRRGDRRPLAARRRHSRRRRPEPQPRRRPRAVRPSAPLPAGSARSRRPSTCSRARSTSPSTSRQATTAFARLGGPEEALRRQLRPHALDLPRRIDGTYVLAQGVAWFDRHLKRTANGVDASQGRDREAAARRPRRVEPGRAAATRPVRPSRSPAGRRRAAARLVSRRTAPLQQARSRPGARARSASPSRGWPATRGSSSPSSPATASSAHGGLQPQARRRNVVKLANYCVYVPKGTRLRVTLGASSPAGQVAYLGFAGSGSATIGDGHAAALRRSRSRSPG